LLQDQRADLVGWHVVGERETRAVRHCDDGHFKILELSGFGRAKVFSQALSISRLNTLVFAATPLAVRAIWNSSGVIEIGRDRIGSSDYAPRRGPVGFDGLF
jgi:hypothetical protein